MCNFMTVIYFIQKYVILGNQPFYNKIRFFLNEESILWCNFNGYVMTDRIISMALHLALLRVQISVQTNKFCSLVLEQAVL